MNPDFCYTKFLTNQIVFDNEKNPNNNKQTKTVKNSSSLKLVKIRFRNNLELVKVDPMKQDTYLKQTILLS